MRDDHARESVVKMLLDGGLAGGRMKRITLHGASGGRLAKWAALSKGAECHVGRNRQFQMAETLTAESSAHVVVRHEDFHGLSGNNPARVSLAGAE